VRQKNTITLQHQPANLVLMNVLHAGVQASTSVLAAFLAFSILMKETPVLNGWDAETDSELPLKNVMTETSKTMMDVLLTAK